MSPQLHVRCALAVLAAALLASALGLLAWGPVPPDAIAHGAPESGSGDAAWPWAALWHAATLAVIGSGWHAARAVPPGAWREAWQSFFALAALSVLTAAVVHVSPGEVGQLLARVPVASAYAMASLLFVAERMGRRWVSHPALAAACLAGPAAGLICGLTELTTGTPDVRALLWLEALPLVMVPLGVWGLQSRGLATFDWLVALALLGVSEAVNWIDLSQAASPGTHLAVHAVHHLALVAALGWLARALGRQRRIQALSPAVAGGGAASQRSTSSSTSER